MKKILIILCLFCFFVLVSCGGKKDTTTRRDDPDTTLYNTLNLSSVRNGKNAYDVDESKNDYYVIKVAENTASSVFCYTSFLDETIEANGDSISYFSVKPLTFTADIASEQAGIISNFYSSAVFSKEALGLSFEPMKMSGWSTNMDAKDVVKGYLENHVKGNAIRILYVPTFVEHYSKSSLALACYVMMPVYYEYVNENEQGVFASYPSFEISFDDNHLLPSRKDY